MIDLKGILALFTACLSFCIVVNFLLFHKNRKSIITALILGVVLFVNQMLEFVTTSWQLNYPVINFIYITTFNLTISFSSYYLLQSLQPDSKQNWKSFIFTIMIIPICLVNLSSFTMLDTGLFFTGYRYIASPIANVVIGLLQSFWGIFFLIKLVMGNRELKKIIHYKLLLWGYLIPPAVFLLVIIFSFSSILYFESIFSKLLILNCASLLYFLIKTNK
jgi:hypothetical protein